MAKANAWTLKRLIEHFGQIVAKKITEIENGSLSFTIHFRNGSPLKVEVETKEHFGGGK